LNLRWLAVLYLVSTARGDALAGVIDEHRP
jgi:hypothetical protein